ncbi:hypothetical protein CHU32_03745 [Superficieibacter electus]|uniref:Uncharacterized protein n=1 Tax=Superficieibacter electus TaxID=2022662 RepID=A0A2P5GVH1_9ENTR|nr:hypothetical protein [Superficieibacter electus]POP42358.1 hypothetical protein CHU33_20030 [Superficieibacter electus]POP50547.1 hypothetical protein CHU32_03745 [Superficieibacter electus]
MSEIKIYTATPADLSPPVDSKSFCVDVVLAADYQALREQMVALAAENSTIKVMNDCLSEELRGYESDGEFEGPKMHLLWWKTETPATDRFIAEQQAIGLERFAEMYALEAAKESDYSTWKSFASNAASGYAQQLRNEVKL